jgi:signal transduction histidine kinase
MALHVLLIIYMALAVLGMVLMSLLHFFHDRTGYYKTATFIWGGILLGFTTDGFLEEHGTGLHHLFGISFMAITMYSMAKLMCDVYRIDIAWKKIRIFSLTSWLLGNFAHFVLGASFEWVAILVCLAVVAPVFVASYGLLRSERKMNILDRLFLMAILGESLHILDYPFLRNVEGAAVYGFSLGMFFTFFVAILTPVVISQRISEMRMEEKLVNSAKMAALGEMAGGIAHEINTPLAVIKMVTSQMAELLEEKDFDQPAFLKTVKTAQATTDRIASIVAGLRLFSRDGSRDAFQKVSVAKVIEQTVSLCRERFKTHSVSLRVDPVSEAFFFDGREVEISQVLLNLLNNAFDAVSGLEEKWVRVAAWAEPDWIEFQVTDCGMGIPPEIRKKIFQPFYTTKGPGKGTGMGLSISLGIVENHRGELLIDTNSVNTKFIIRLPRKQPRAHNGVFKSA